MLRAPRALASRPARPCRGPRESARTPNVVSQCPVARAPGRFAAPSCAQGQRLPVTYRDLAGRVASLSHDTACLLPLLACNTILVLQYTSTAPAIQPNPPSLQYNHVYCNTITNITTHFQPLALQSQSQYNTCIVIQFPLSQYNLGNSLIHFSTNFFFFFQIFPAIGKCPKKIIFILFFFQYTPNKFMKIYFLHFSLTLHTVKLLDKYFFSSYKIFFFTFPATGKHKKLYAYIFFFFIFSEYSNKFIKIYFIQFSSVLHCKTLKINFSSPHNQINL